ncbi:MAG: hypothetical protein J6Y24_05410 [Bacteroidales bacterium]|nr:hypothetical protein [Bacteroidales bacterium]
MDSLYDMFLNLFIKISAIRAHRMSCKAVIVLAVLLCNHIADAQEYNNWLLPNGVILNFNTSPATIICDEGTFIDIKSWEFNNYIVSLSNDNGQMLLYGYQTNNKYVIKKNGEQEVASFEALEVRNIIGCKLSQNDGYCIAAVFTTKSHFKTGELHIYFFNNSGVLKKEYVYNDNNYGSFLDFVQLDDYVGLLAYRTNQVETYKLSTEGCELWATSEIPMNQFTSYPTRFFDIDHTLNYEKIIATSANIAYILKFDQSSGKVSLFKSFESNQYRTMAFSPTDKYYLIIDDNSLKGFRYDNNYDFNLKTPDLVYNLPKTNEIVCNQCWEMALGVDNKIYIHHQNTNQIIVLDGIESGIITEERISSECITTVSFPRIPRPATATTETITVCPSATKKYSVESPEAGYTYHWNVSGGTLSNDTGTETTVIWNNTEGEGTLSVYAEESLTGCKSDITEYKVHRQKAPSAQFDNAQVCYGEPLKIILNGNAPYNIFYTFNGENKTITTSNTEYQMDNIVGRYQITKVTDQFCETSIKENNTAEILPKLNKLTIKTNNE